MQQISKVLTDYAEDAEESGQLNAIVREIESLLKARDDALSKAAAICRERAALILSESLGKNVAIECAELIEAARTK
jgi:hypothetical protein